MNRFENLTEGVVLGLQTEINNYQRSRERQLELRKQQRKKNKKKTPTTMEELLEVPAVKQSREGR